jgi:hypothetical protein
MAGWMKELMLDYGLNRLSIDQRSDISTAISTLISAGVITNNDINVLHSYIAGYTAIEIAQQEQTTTDQVEAQLTRIFRAIEYASGYTDSSFIQRAKQQYNARMAELSAFLLKHGQRFYTHDSI